MSAHVVGKFVILRTVFFTLLDYIQCDYCGRRFNETAAERHIKFCKEQHERLPNKKKVDATALNRAAARTGVGSSVI